MERCIFVLLMLFILPGKAAAFPDEGDPKMDLSGAAVERGRQLFMETCNQCHGLKYFRSREHPEGIQPQIDAESGRATFGVAPPDLSTMAIAQGKRLNGVRYIYRLLTTYHADENGQLLNRAFAEKTKGAGRIAMPEPIPGSDPELKRKAMDISVFLLDIAEPADRDSRRIGRFVLAYMAVLTIVLWALNRVTWKDVKKRP